MKNRLQKLWDEVTPEGGPCPQPDVKKVQRRVDAALDGRTRTVQPRRVLRYAAVIAAALLLLTGTALAGGELIPPEFNVLSDNFTWGENPANAIAMMTITPVSVSDENYTMTVTSSLADGNKLYFTLIIEPENNEAREWLENTAFSDPLSYRIFGSSSMGSSGGVDPETGALQISVAATWIPAKNASVRLNAMKKGIWLEFPVKEVRSLKLKINAEAQGMGSTDFVTGGPVNVKTMTLSPLSFALDYTTPQQGTLPVLYFLYKDGSIRTMSQLHVLGPSGSGSSVFGDPSSNRYKFTWQFGSIQDLSQMEAVIFGGIAYPLDGSKAYEADTSTCPQPFTIPIGEKLGDSMQESVPLFALCDGLGADCQWDEETGTAIAVFRGVTLTFALGSNVTGVEGIPWDWDTSEEDAAPVYRDGELWVDAAGLLRTVWDLDMTPAVEDIMPILSGEIEYLFSWWIVAP